MRRYEPWCLVMCKTNLYVPCLEGTQEIRVEGGRVRGVGLCWRVVLRRLEGGRGDDFRWQTLVRALACLLCVVWVGLGGEWLSHKGGVRSYV